MELVEQPYKYTSKQTFAYQGEKELTNVQFNHPNSLKLLMFATAKEVNKNALSVFIWQTYPQLKELAKSESAERSVCAKIVHNGQTIVQCLDCRMDQSCIICLDCFKKGNHAGHKILYKKAFGGCCDCGDAEAWDPKGFCTSHSGQIQDVPIDEATVSQFTRIFQDIFFIYYRFKLTRESQKNETMFLHTVCQLIEAIISEGPKGIKLMAIFLQSKLPASLKFNEELQGQRVLYHLFTWRFINRDVRLWENLFIKMFPYYEFKRQLLAAYIECYPRFYVSQEACMPGQSISCQILTSYKLVEDYIDSHHSQPICYNISNITDQDHISCVSSMLFADLEKISKLPDPIPGKYMKLQTSAGVKSIFTFHNLINQQMTAQKGFAAVANDNAEQKEKAKKKKKKKNNIIAEPVTFFNPIFFMIKNVRQSYNEHCSLQIFNIMLRTLKDDHTSLFKILKECASLIDSDSQELLIFRVYDRAFALTMFALCNQRLQKLQDPQFRNQIMYVLQKSQNQFQNWLIKVQSRILRTYFFYTHILCNQNRGYHSSFFNYIYLYRSKDQFLVSTDTIQLKILALLRRTPLVIDFPRVLRFQDFDQEKWSLFILNTMYHEMQMIYSSKCAEIYVSHYDLQEKDASPLKNDVIQYLAKFIVGEGNTVTLERANKFCKIFLFDNSQLMKKYLCECSIYSKEKKAFELMQNYRSQLPINYLDFELRLKDDKFSNKNAEQARPEVSLALIRGYNKAVLQHYWSESNTETFKQIVINLYEEINASGVHDHLIDLALLECKFCSIIKEFCPSQRALIIQELLVRAPISPQISQKLTQYRHILGSQEVQAESKLLEKKQMLRLKKLKKMQEIKKKNSENMSAIRQVHQIEEQNTIGEDYCAICRKKESPKYQLVYLASLSIRNLQKLTKGGPGVQTVSFTTCYHVFDYECLEKESKNDYQGVLKCPICRRVGNIYLPAYPTFGQESHPFISAFLERVTQVMMTIHNFQEIDPLQQLFKSFYHYVLLYQYQEEYVRRCRTKLYQTILDIIQHKSIRGQLIEKVAARFLNNQTSLNPKLYKKDKVSILNLKEQEYEINSSSEEEDQSYEDFMILSYPRGQSKKKSQQIEKIVKKVVIPPVFRYIGLRILKNAYQKKQNISQQQSMVSQQSKGHAKGLQKDVKQDMEIEGSNIEEMLKNAQLPIVCSDIQNAVDQLFGTPQGMKTIKIEAPRLQLTQMPKTFYWNMGENTCDLCKNTSHDIFICLLCPWKGCLNCKSGGVNKHFPISHGETSAFMRLNEGIIYQIGTKLIKKIGCIYVNEWGEELKLKNDWNSYMLQEEVLEKTKNMLLRDQ